LVLAVNVRFGNSIVDYQNQIGKRLQWLLILILPAFIKELIERVPVLKLQQRFKFDLDDLEMLRYDIFL
jgi:hypothetical protein